MINVKVIQRPHEFAFSKNQLLWRFFTVNPQDAGCLVDIKIHAETINDNDPTKTKDFQLQIKPDADGFANAYLQDIIDSMIEYEMPYMNGNIIQRAQHMMKVTISYRRVSTASPSESYIITEPERYIIKGGIEQLKHDHNNYFSYYQAVNKNFATWMPNFRFIGIDDETMISLLMQTIESWQLKINIVYTDSTTENILITPLVAVEDFYLYHIRCGAIALGVKTAAATAGKDVYTYSIQAVNIADNSITYSELYIFYIDYRVFYNAKLLYCFNSLGGVDTLRVLGDVQDDYSRSYSETELFTGQLVVGEPTAAQYGQTNITRLNTYKADIGFRHRKTEVYTLQEFFTAPIAWDWVFDKLRRIFILNKGDKLSAKTDKKFTGQLEWRYGFTEQVFTPAEKDFGVGNDTETYGGTCPTAATLYTPTAIGLDFFGFWNETFTWATDAEAMYYIFEYKKSTDVDWIRGHDILGNILQITTQPLTYAFEAGFTFNWRIVTVCGPSDESVPSVSGTFNAF